MVKPKSPRILAAAAVAALVAGLSSCATPQTLQTYTPAEGINVDVRRQGAAPDTTEVPLKVRNLMIVTTGPTGIISAAIMAPPDRSDQLASVEGRVYNTENEPDQQIQPITADVDLPAGQLVVLTDGERLQVTGAPLEPGGLAELKLTFADSQEQLVLVPIVDGDKEDYRSLTTPSPEPAPAQPGADQTAEPPAADQAQPTPAPEEATPQPGQPG